MPHLIVEYSANLRDELGPDAFIECVHTAAEATGEFPAGSLRTRAEERDRYRIGDGHPANGFVHIVFRVRPRDAEARRKLGEPVFQAACAFLDPLFAGRAIGFTFEVQEIDTQSRFLKNFRTPPGT